MISLLRKKVENKEVPEDGLMFADDKNEMSISKQWMAERSKEFTKLKKKLDALKLELETCYDNTGDYLTDEEEQQLMDKLSSKVWYSNGVGLKSARR